MNVVTGGSGFLGGAIVRALLERGETVRALGRAEVPELEAAGAQTARCDLADRAGLERAFEGATCVFHAAAKTGVWGPRSEYFATNVEGTRKVLEACRAVGVPRLVHTSTPSVVFDGSDHVNAGPELPYPDSYLCAYPETKAVAEREVLAANGTGGLATVALRPHLIFGPGDPHLVPRLIDRARRGRLRIVGDGDNQVSLTYVDNAARAHLSAADRLAPDAPCAGRAYFVVQEEPVQLWTWIAELLAALGEPPVTRRLSARTARAAGAVLERVWSLLRLGGEPPMTRFVAQQLALSHSYDPEPARRDLGHREEIGMAEATRRLVEHLRGGRILAG